MSARTVKLTIAEIQKILLCMSNFLDHGEEDAREWLGGKRGADAAHRARKKLRAALTHSPKT